MIADLLVAMSTQTTADESWAQLKDVAAWVPKHMQLTYKKTKEYFKTNNPEPSWAKDQRDQGQARGG